MTINCQFEITADNRFTPFESLGHANFQQIAGVPLWDKIKVPALVIKGEHSTRFTPDELAEIRARAPQVQMAEVPASDHHFMRVIPSEYSTNVAHAASCS